MQSAQHIEGPAKRVIPGVTYPKPHMPMKGLDPKSEYPQKNLVPWSLPHANFGEVEVWTLIPKP